LQSLAALTSSKAMTSWLEASCWLRAWVSVRQELTETALPGTLASLAGGPEMSAAVLKSADDELDEY